MKGKSPDHAQSGKENIMENNELIEKLMQFYEENHDDFAYDLNSYLDSDLRYPMNEIDEVFYEKSPSEIQDMKFCAHDEDGDTFNPNRKYFYFDGIGNLVSTDDDGCSEYLDEFTVRNIIKTVPHFQLSMGTQAIINA